MLRHVLYRLLPILVFCLTVSTFGTALADGITIEQLLDVEQVRSVQLSPDGKSALYTVSRNRALEDEAGSGYSELWVVGTGGGDARPFVTGKVSVSSPHFSPDGRYIGFKTTRGDKAKGQVWVIPVDGGESQVATASSTGVGSWAWSHDGSAI